MADMLQLIRNSVKKLAGNADDAAKIVAKNAGNAEMVTKGATNSISSSARTLSSVLGDNSNVFKAPKGTSSLTSPVIEIKPAVGAKEIDNFLIPGTKSHQFRKGVKKNNNRWAGQGKGRHIGSHSYSRETAIQNMPNSVRKRQNRAIMQDIKNQKAILAKDRARIEAMQALAEGKFATAEDIGVKGGLIQRSGDKLSSYETIRNALGYDDRLSIGENIENAKLTARATEGRISVLEGKIIPINKGDDIKRANNVRTKKSAQEKIKEQKNNTKKQETGHAEQTTQGQVANQEVNSGNKNNKGYWQKAKEHKIPQAIIGGAFVLGMGANVTRASDERGQQSNAQLYGQQTYYR